MIRKAAFMAMVWVLSTAWAQAAFVVPSFRGEVDTTYQEWDFFASATNAAPDIASENPNGEALFSSAMGTRMGSGNIYAFGAIDQFTVLIPEFGYSDRSTKVVVQTRTEGAELNYASMLLNGIAPDVAELLSSEPGTGGGFPGLIVDYYFAWTLPDNPSLLTLTFAGIEHTSLSAISIDTAAVPEAGSLVMMTCAGLLAGSFCYRKRRRVVEA